MKIPEPSPGELTKIGCGARNTFFSTVLTTTTDASTLRTTSRIGCAFVCAAPKSALVMISADRIKFFIFDHLLKAFASTYNRVFETHIGPMLTNRTVPPLFSHFVQAH